jgi:type IV pilus assembly protein PilV
MIVESRKESAPIGSQRAFTLVEAMVAMVILTVGMIGVAAMYVRGLDAGRTARYRMQSVDLVADLADRIRVNRLGQASYSGAPANNNCDPAGGVDCNPVQMAAHDLFLWGQNVVQALPNGQWAVDFDPATLPPSFSIAVSWIEAGEGRIEQRMTIQVPTT